MQTAYLELESSRAVVWAQSTPIPYCKQQHIYSVQQLEQVGAISPKQIIVVLSQLSF